MTENQIETIDFDEFQSIADGFIDRSAHELEKCRRHLF